MQFEYHTDFVPLPLANEKEVDIEAFLKDPKYLTHMTDMGRLGWELVSSQPIIEAQSGYSFLGSDKFAWSITTGFLLFWKKTIL